MLRRLAALLLAPALLAVVAFWGSSASAADSNAAAFVAKANSERQARGLRAYDVSSELAVVARRHAGRMAAQKSLHHNPRLGAEVSGWQVVGENVGMGGTVGSIHKAFMDSPEHRANILARDYTQIGIGTVTDSDGIMWVVQVFRLPMKAVVAAPAPARPRVVIASRKRTAAPVTPRRTPARAVVTPPRTVTVPVPARPAAVESSALVGALAESTAVGSFGQALAYADSMAALGG